MKGKRPDTLFVGFALALALLGGVAWFEWRNTARAKETAELVAHTHKVQANLDRLLSLIQDIESAARGFVVTGDPAFLVPFDSGLKAVVEQRHTLEQLIHDAEQKANLSALEPLIAERIVLAQRIVGLRQNSGFEATRQEVASGRGKAVMNTLRAGVAQMDAKEQTLLDHRSAATRRESDTAQRLIIFGTSLSFVLLIAVFALVLSENRLRQQAEAVHKAGALQSAIFNSANFSSIATDANGVIQIFNVGAERMLGYTAADVMNKITPADISDPQEVIARAKALSVELRTPITPGFDALVFKASRGIEDIYELTYIRKDGSRFPAVVSVTALRDAQDAIIGYLLIGTDNTARKQAIELEYASRMKSEFLANMSHELRTPLNGIIGFTEFLIDEKSGPLRPKQKEYLGDVLNSARHLLQLINDVLDLAKVEAGKMELHPETFPVRKAVEEVTAVIKGIARKKHIAVGIEVSDGLDAVTLDQHKFKQVLYNLLSNAVKFTDEGGKVDIHARRLDQHRLEVQVRDTGIGIKAEDINRLFTEFEQLDSGTARRFEGTGLGLALTKKIIEVQGGRIDVQSEPGKGSVFTVVLPVMTGEGQTA